MPLRMPRNETLREVDDVVTAIAERRQMNMNGVEPVEQILAEPPGVDSGIGTDMDCNGVVDDADFDAYFVPNFMPVGKPGPSGLACAGTVPCN